MKTTTEALNLADQVANLELQLAELTSAQDAEVNAIKNSYKKRIDGIKKQVTNAKRRLSTWLKKHAPKLFDGHETGTTKTNVAEVAWRKNPDSIKKLDSKESDDELINRALAAGHDSCVRTKHTIDKEALAKLTDAELEALGWYRVPSKGLAIRPLANPSKATRSKVA